MHRFRFLPSYHYADSTDGIILHPAELTLRDYTITGSADGVGDCAEKRSDIPAAYEQLSFLESTATQYINTGIMHGDIAGFDIKYRSTGSNAKNNVLGLDGVMGVNGVMVSSTNPRGDLKIWFANNPSGTGTSTKIGVQVAYPTAGTNWSKSYDSLDSYYATIHHVKLTTDGTLYYNEEAVQEDIVPATPSSSLSVYLFRAHNISKPESGKYRFYSYTRMYYAKFYGADGALLGDFIPCKRRSDGVLGMYDAVSGTFFTNKGTGTFLSAPLTYKIPILNNGTVAAEIVRSAPLYAGESISCRADGLPKVPLSPGSNALTIGTAVQPDCVSYRYDTY